MDVIIIHPLIQNTLLLRKGVSLTTNASLINHCVPHFVKSPRVVS